MRCVASWYKYHSSFTTWITLLVAAAAAAVASIVYHKNYKKTVLLLFYKELFYKRTHNMCTHLPTPHHHHHIFCNTRQETIVHTVGVRHEYESLVNEHLVRVDLYIS